MSGESKDRNSRKTDITHKTKEKGKLKKKLQQSVTSMWEKEEDKRRRYKEIHKMWGDNPDDKEEGDMRITSTNINGLSNTVELLEYIIGSKRFNSDINCFQEINVNTNKAEVVQDLRKAINDVDETRGSSFQVSTIPDSKLDTRGNRRKKRGGTMVHVEERWTGASMKKKSDPISRWSSISIEGKGDRKLTIFSVYRVNDNNLETAGGETAWLQEYRALLERGDK